MQIPHQQFRLSNGLNVILHRDLRLPQVVVNLLYNVGSRDDPPGRSGMAHLFEHLMFMGTSRIPEHRIDQIMEEAGGWNNAYTSRDMTVYYDVGPSRLLARLLWIEADRMASLARSMSREKLNLQRDVVLNELRQSYENQPYGKAMLLLPTLMYPAGHPYARPVIGSSGHLKAVTVADVKRFFSRYYAPQNASLVVAGPLDLSRARGLIQRYFQWIPSPGKPPHSTPQPAAPVALKGEVRQRLTDKVKLTRIYLVWHSPAFNQPGDAEMDLAAEILADGKQSRLHRSLVHQQKLALDVDAFQESRRLGSQFVVQVTAREEVPAERLLSATDKLLREFRSAPPLPEELRRAKIGYETHFVTKLERLQRRAELLNVYWAHTANPGHLQEDLDRYRQVTAAGIHGFVKEALKPRQRVVLIVEPEGEKD